MKKIIGLLLIIALMAFGSEITYKADFKIEDLNKIRIHLIRVQQYLDQIVLG